MTDTWRTVSSRGQSDARLQVISKDLADESAPYGFRTFEPQVTIYTVLLVRKLKQRYPDVDVDAVVNTPAAPAQVSERTPFTYVLLTLHGPKKFVNMAYDDAAPLLRTGTRDRDVNRFIIRKWFPPEIGFVDNGASKARARNAVQRLDLHANWSPTDACFFVTTILLAGETQQTTVADAAMRMLSDFGDFMSLQTTDQTFRMSQTPATASDGRGPRRRQDAPHTAGVVQQQLHALNVTRVAELKIVIRDMVSAKVSLWHTDVLAFLHFAYDLEMAYVNALYAENEMQRLSIKWKPETERMVEVTFDPSSGIRPFTQRYPRISFDDEVTIRQSGNYEEEKCRIFYVFDYKLVLHVADSGIAARCAAARSPVDITFSPKQHIGHLQKLQKATSNRAAFQRLIGTHERLQQPAPPTMRHNDAPPSSESDSRGRGRGGDAGAWTERGRGRGQGDLGDGPRAERGGFASRGRGAATAVRTPQEEATPVYLDGLSFMQKHAVEEIMSGDDARYFISGPGGTGKTEVIARAILHAAECGQRVIVMAATVAAADVIAHRAITLALTHEDAADDNRMSTRILRYYRRSVMPLNVSPLLFDHSNGVTETADSRKMFHELKHGDRFVDEISDEDLEHKSIIICSGSASVMRLPSRFRESVSHLFMDEAGSIGLCDAILAIDSVPPLTKMVFSGDPNQLRPRVSCPALHQYLQIGPLWPAYAANMTTFMLRESYRSSAELVDLQSKLFYDGKLRVATNNPESAYQDNYPQWAGHRGGRPYVARILHCDCEESTSTEVHRVPSAAASAPPSVAASGGGQLADVADTLNDGEIRAVENVIQTLMMDVGVKPENVGVLCEYQAQRRRLRSRLDMQRAKLVLVSQIEDVQGQERDVIIASLVRSKADTQDVFALNLSKLCTAVTRARRLLVIVCNVPVFLQLESIRHANRNSIGPFTRLVDECKHHNSVDVFDAATQTYQNAPRIQQRRQLEVKEFIPKSQRDAVDAQRRYVPKSNVMDNAAPYFVGVVVGRHGGRYVVANRFKSVHDVLIDEDVSSGHKRDTVFPGDLVAVRLATDLARWIPLPEDYVVTTELLPIQQRILSSVARSERHRTLALDDFPNSAMVERVDRIPVGMIVCVLQFAEWYLDSITGHVEHNVFYPAGDSFPAIELLGRGTASENTLVQAQVVTTEIAGELERRYQLLSQAPPRTPAIRSPWAIAPVEYERMLRVATPITTVEGWFALLKDQRGLHAPLARFSEETVNSTDRRIREVDVIVAAPAAGILLGTDADLNSACFNALWSPTTLDEIHAGSEYPCPITVSNYRSDGAFALPVPGDRLLMVGVEFRVRFGVGGPESGKICAAPGIRLFSRSKDAFPGPAEKHASTAQNALRRGPGETLLSPRMQQWQHTLLLLAGHAVAEALTLAGLPALLLRQAVSLADEGHFDRPQWYTAPTPSATGDVPFMGCHAPSGHPLYTSFANAHHCAGDAVVQRQMAAAAGAFPEFEKRVTPDSLRILSNKLTARGL